MNNRELILAINQRMKTIVITSYILIPIFALTLLASASFMLSEINLIDSILSTKVFIILGFVYLFVGLMPFVFYLIRFRKFKKGIDEILNSNIDLEILDNDVIKNIIYQYKSANKPNFYMLFFIIVGSIVYFLYAVSRYNYIMS